MGVVLIFFIFILNTVTLINSSILSIDYYKKSCPNVEETIRDVLVKKMTEDPRPNITLPGTLRLFFHDCFVEGCDGSILVTSTGKNKVERDAEISLSLAGDAFDIVERAKKALEETCPGVVSCSDILAILARDVVVLVDGPHWEVEKGRKDGLISAADQAQEIIPAGETNLTNLIRLFKSKKLSTVDLVTLSGAHTIGFSHCSEFVDRINRKDPTMDPALRKDMISACPIPHIDKNVAQALDQYTPNTFDNFFFKSLIDHKGLLTSDQVLFSSWDHLSRSLVYKYAKDQELFFKEFANAMVKLGRIGVKTGNEGEIRRECTKFN